MKTWFPFGQARLLQAKLLLKTKDYDGVAVEAGQVLKQDDTNLEALLLRGQAYFYLGDNDLALRWGSLRGSLNTFLSSHL